MAEPLSLGRRVQRLRWLSGLHGVLAVEAAYVLPVVIAAAMMFIELAHIGLIINMGSGAFDRAVQQFRQDGVASLAAGGMEELLRQRISAESHNYLSEDEIATVDIQSYATLDAMGGGSASAKDGDAGARTNVPAWHIAVDIRKDFITPLPRLLGVDSGAFRYRYEQVLAYLPQQESQP